MAKKFRDPALERQWRDRVAAWAASGLTMRAFCDRQQLTETTFRHWRRELRERDAASALPPSSCVTGSSSAGPPTFVPVTILPNAEPAVPAATHAVEVRCPSGHVVSLPNVDAATLRGLFAALASRAGEGSPC